MDIFNMKRSSANVIITTFHRHKIKLWIEYFSLHCNKPTDKAINSLQYKVSQHEIEDKRRYHDNKILAKLEE